MRPPTSAASIVFDEDGEDLLFSYPPEVQSRSDGRSPPPTSALGDVRWAGSTALHGAAVMGQPSIIRFLVEKGAKLDARNVAGWTPLMVTQGMLIAANARFYPLTEALLKQLMTERGMDPAKYSRRPVTTSVIKQKPRP